MFAILFLGIVAAVLLAAALGVLVFIGAAFRGEAPETASHHPPEQSQPQLEETLLQPADETAVSLSACSGDAAAVRRGCSSRLFVAAALSGSRFSC